MKALWILYFVTGGYAFPYNSHTERQLCINDGMIVHGQIEELKFEGEALCKNIETKEIDYVSRRIWSENAHHRKEVERRKNIKFTEEMWQKRRKELKEKLYMCLDSQQFGRPTPQCAHRLNNQISEESAYYAKRIKEDASKP